MLADFLMMKIKRKDNYNLIIDYHEVHCEQKVHH